MESTSPLRSDATCSVTATSLAAAFAPIPDPRRQGSITYSLPTLLAVAVAALLCNRTSVLAMAEWAADQEAEVLAQFGVPEGQRPPQSTLHRLFRRLDGQAVAAALGQYFQATTEEPSERGSQGIAIDGKAQRGRLQDEPRGCPIHALSAFCQEYGVVLAQEPVEHGTDKQEAELTVAPELVAAIDWPGRVLTGDALSCQRDLCQQVCAASGEYLLVVTANQPRLSGDLELFFALPLLDQREARTIDQGHGRTAEVRHLIASADPAAYLDWPGVAQGFRLERTWTERGTVKRQVRYGITSLPPEVGTAPRLLALKRGHWGIENLLHRAKDVTLGEDASLVHTGQGPIVIALLRDAALNLLRRSGCQQITSRLRHLSQHPDEAAALLLRPAHA